MTTDAGPRASDDARRVRRRARPRSPDDVRAGGEVIPVALPSPRLVQQLERALDEAEPIEVLLEMTGQVVSQSKDTEELAMSLFRAFASEVERDLPESMLAELRPLEAALIEWMEELHEDGHRAVLEQRVGGGAPPREGGGDAERRLRRLAGEEADERGQLSVKSSGDRAVGVGVELLLKLLKFLSLLCDVLSGERRGE